MKSSVHQSTLKHNSSKKMAFTTKSFGVRSVRFPWAHDHSNAAWHYRTSGHVHRLKSPSCRPWSYEPWPAQHTPPQSTLTCCTVQEWDITEAHHHELSSHLRLSLPVTRTQKQTLDDSSNTSVTGGWTNINLELCDFSDEGNADWITEFNHKNVIYCMAHNLANFGWIVGLFTILSVNTKARKTAVNVKSACRACLSSLCYYTHILKLVCVSI